MQWVADHRAEAFRTLRRPNKELAPHLLGGIMRNGCSLLVDTLVV